MGATVSRSATRDLAEELCLLYHEAIRSELAQRTKNSATRSMPTRHLHEVDRAARRAFLTTAHACAELGADAREYIVAQFATWRAASAYHKKLLWPSPHHLGTLAARVRYLLFKGREEIRLSRVSEVEEQDGKRRWYVEERRLRGLARVQRRDVVDVLTEQPEQFSREFLRHKGVWEVVEDLWTERQRS